MIAFPIALPYPDPRKIELAHLLTHAEMIRESRLFEQSRRDNGRGQRDPWTVAHIIDVAAWRLLDESGLESGVLWFTAKHGGRFRVRRGDPRTFSVFKSELGYTPCTAALRDELLEGSAEFRMALANGSLREVEREVERPGASA